MCLTDFHDRLDDLLAGIEHAIVHWIDTGDLDEEWVYNQVRACRSLVSGARYVLHRSLDSAKPVLTSTK